MIIATTILTIVIITRIVIVKIFIIIPILVRLLYYYTNTLGSGFKALTTEATR